MATPASYIFSAFSFLFSLPKEQLLRVGHMTDDGNPIPSFDEGLLISLCDDASEIFKNEQISIDESSNNQVNNKSANTSDKKKERSHFLEEKYFANHAHISCYKYSERLFNAFMNAFAYLPICAIINKTSICLHGGLTPLLDKVRTIQKQIQRPVHSFDQSPLLTDITWGDPAPNQSQLFCDNPRGRGKCFNGPVVVNFLKNNNLKRLIRAHECVNTGIEKNFNGKCITVFSSSSYTCDLGNSCGILKIYQKDDKTQSIIFDPIVRLKKCDAGYYKVQSFNQTRPNLMVSNTKIPLYKSGFLNSTYMKVCRTSSDHNLKNCLSRNDNDADNVIQKDASNPLSPGRRQVNLVMKLPSFKSGPRKKTSRPINAPLIFTPQMISQSNDFINRAQYCE